MPPISYTKKTLINKERIVYAASLHSFCYFLPIFFMLLGLAMFFFQEIQDKADESETVQSYKDSIGQYVDEAGREKDDSGFSRSSGTLDQVQGFFSRVFGNFVAAMPEEFKEYLKEANHVRMMIFGTLLFLVGFMKFINAILAKISTEQVVTSKKIVYKRGFVRVNEVEIPVSRVEGVKVFQTAFDRMLDRGNILINGIGMEQIEVKKIAKPIKFRNAAYAVIDSYTERSSHDI